MKTRCKGCMESGEHLPKISLFPRGPDFDAHYESIYSSSKVYLFTIHRCSKLSIYSWRGGTYIHKHDRPQSQ